MAMGRTMKGLVMAGLVLAGGGAAAETRDLTDAERKEQAAFSTQNIGSNGVWNCQGKTTEELHVLLRHSNVDIIEATADADPACLKRVCGPLRKKVGAKINLLNKSPLFTRESVEEINTLRKIRDEHCPEQ